MLVSVALIGDLAALGVVAGAIVAVGAVGRGIYRTIKRVGETEDALPVLLEIAKEFSTNGGDSLRDQIDAIRRGQEEAARRMDEWAERHEALDAARFEAIAVAARRAGWELEYPRESTTGERRSSTTWKGRTR